MRLQLFRTFTIVFAPALILLAGCGGGVVTANPSNSSFFISPGVTTIDTNCTGCNGVNAQGAAVEQFAATLTSGSAAKVAWSVSGGDAISGPGAITSNGQYTPPSYLTADRAQVVVTAALDSGARASTVLTVTPGFLQPLTPENAAVGANGQVIITGYLAEAGGSANIEFALASTATGSTGGQGSLGPTNCQRSSQAFTFCTVTFTAPASAPANGAAFVVATVSGSAAKAESALLLNLAGISSNPVTHQTLLAGQVSNTERNQ